MNKLLLAFGFFCSTAINSYAVDAALTQRSPTKEEKMEIAEMLKTSPPSPKEMEAIKMYSAIAIELMKDKGFSKFGYDATSVETLSNVVNEERFNYSDDEKKLLPSLYGAYLGEAVVQNYGGTWVKFGDGSFGLDMKNGHYIMPIRRATKNIQNGAEDSMIAFYISMKERQ